MILSYTLIIPMHVVASNIATDDVTN